MDLTLFLMAVRRLQGCGAAKVWPHEKMVCAMHMVWGVGREWLLVGWWVFGWVFGWVLVGAGERLLRFD